MEIFEFFSSGNQIETPLLLSGIARKKGKTKKERREERKERREEKKRRKQREQEEERKRGGRGKEGGKRQEEGRDTCDEESFWDQMLSVTFV